MSGYGSMSGTGQDAGQRMTDEMRDKGEQAVEQVKQSAGEAMDQARERTLAMLDQQKGRAAEGLGSVAAALRSTGQQLNNQDQGAFGQYAERAAEKVDAIAGQLRDKDVDQLMYEAERFARREPELFLGGAVVLGLLAARFFKASNSRRREMRGADYGYRGYGQRYGGSGYRGGDYGPGQYGTGQSYRGGTYGTEQTYGSGESYRGAGFSSSGTEDYRTAGSTFGRGTEEADWGSGARRDLQDDLEANTRAGYGSTRTTRDMEGDLDAGTRKGDAGETGTA